MATGYFSNIYSGRAGKHNNRYDRKRSWSVGSLRVTQKTTGRSVQKIRIN